MYNTLDIKDIKFNLLIDIKYPKSNSYISKKELMILKEFKIGILDTSCEVTKLEFEAIRLFNIIKAFNAILYTHEKDQYSPNKHIHAIISCNKFSLDEIVSELISNLSNLKLIRHGDECVIWKALKNYSIKDKGFKDVKSQVPFYELKGNGVIYYIAPIIQEVNIYTYINKYQKNPYNNLNYIIK